MTMSDKEILFDRWRSEEAGMRLVSPENSQEALDLVRQHHDELLRQAREQIDAEYTKTDED